MSTPLAVRRALLSTFDKTGIVEFARALHTEFGVELISTGGTARVLREAGLPVTLVESLTGSPEMLDGRVKTLHPRIHAAILADRDNPEHMRQLAEEGIQPIDMVVVNLYPFRDTIARPGCTFEEAIEMIDIGGPCLLRAAAKNHRHVWPVLAGDEERHQRVLAALRGTGEEDPDRLRRVLAARCFGLTKLYDHAVRDYLLCRGSDVSPESVVRLDATRVLVLEKHALAKYGENPHQLAAVYREDYRAPGESPLSELPSDTPLSFNNYIDATAAWELCAELTRAGEVWHRLPAGDSQTAVWHGLIARDSPSSESHQRIAGDAPENADSQKEARWRQIDDEVFHRRSLPHLQRPGATYFVTFRVRQRSLTPEERDLVMECCLFGDGKTICLHEAMVMPDHVHLVFTPLESSPDGFHPLAKIMHSIKGNSGRKVADHRGRGSGPVWQDEVFDHIVRSERDFWETLEYVYTNPARSGLETEGPYPWCVHEVGSAWDRRSRGAVADTQRALSTESTQSRPWHRLLAGATPSTGAAPSTGATPAIVCFLKHTNACGVALHGDPLEAYRRAYLGDPNAAMGGILAVNFPVAAEFAAAVIETYQRFGKPLKDAGAAYAPGGFFIEVWLAPSFDDDAVQAIRTRKEWGKRVRLLAVGNLLAAPDPDRIVYRQIAGGMLAQTPDLSGLNEDQWKVVTERSPSETEMSDLRLAWLICKHTKSNAITICRDGMLIGNGAGQMSRVMSCRIATWLAGENGHGEALHGAVAASDAFFPFRDGPDLLAEAGVTALIQPGGSKRDDDVIRACNERGLAMIFTGTRHFKH